MAVAAAERARWAMESPLEDETMADMVLRCTRCGKVDDTRNFKNANVAQASMAHWACSRCAWTDWELVEADKAAEPIEAAAAHR